VDDIGTNARFSGPTNVASDRAGNVYVYERYNNVIRKIAPDGTVSTLAGQRGSTVRRDGQATQASFADVRDLTIDPAGNLYVLEVGVNQSGGAIRKVTADGTVTTVPNSSAVVLSTFHDYGLLNSYSTWSTGIAADGAGNLYTIQANRIWKLTAAGEASVLAGQPETGNADGQGASAFFSGPSALAADASGNVYVVDPGNQAIRKVTPSGTVTTIASDPALQTPGARLSISSPRTRPSRWLQAT
jgi:sugar lactone lactonase YvrE